GSVAGKPVVIVSADHQIKPDVGSAIARRWYDVEQVDVIVDVPVSAVGLAVQNVAKEKKKMLIVHSTGTADFHGKFCSPYTMQWVFDTRALAVGTAQEVVKRGGDTWFFLTADYAFGHSLEQQASEVMRKWGKSPRCGASSVCDSGPFLVHPAGADIESEDHRDCQRPPRQYECDQAGR